MNIVSMAEYERRKIKALHSAGDWKVETSPMDEYGAYHKAYISDRGAEWIEVVRPVTKKVEVNLSDLHITTTRAATVEMEFTEVEGWGRDGISLYAYERR